MKATTDVNFEQSAATVNDGDGDGDDSQSETEIDPFTATVPNVKALW